LFDRARKVRLDAGQTLFLAGDPGDGRIVIRQRVTQSDIAAMAGIVRENFSRVMRDWLSRSLVSRISGHYCVENRSLLEHESDF
jgi:CRP-like cAMP-binding protein